MIRLIVPDMPTAAELLPFLERIDLEQRYSNGGELVQELEQSLGDLLRAPVAVVSNGTVALELALRALRLPRGSGVAVPAMTFVATGQAIVNAGLKPVLCDVDPLTWQLTPASVIEAAEGWQIRAALPVASFGMPVSIEPWEKFARDTRLPVVIDAAGALTGQSVSPSPNLITTFSMHATKFVGAGEGGVVATADKFLLGRVAAMACFGHSGTNAKMSEYHAAVALASMTVARMTGKMQRTGDVARAYAGELATVRGVTLQRPPTSDSTMLPVLLPKGIDALTIQQWLAAVEVETKQWYRPFLDELQQFGTCPRPYLLPVTQMLRSRMLGLPFHGHLAGTDIASICGTLRDVMR